MAKKKIYYAVRKGHKPGIYQSWEECQHQVSGFPKNEYKGFSNLVEAKEYLSSFVNEHCTNESYEGAKSLEEIKVQPSTSEFIPQVKNSNIVHGKGPSFENACLKSSPHTLTEDGECSDYISLETIHHEPGDHEREYIIFSSLSGMCDLLCNDLNYAGDISELHGPTFLLHERTTLERHASPIKKDEDSELLHFASESHLLSYLGLGRPKAPATNVAVRYFHELYKLEFSGVFHRKICKAGAAILLRLPNDSVRWQSQLNGEYMMNLTKEADNLMNAFKIIVIKHIKNDSNFLASSLANRAVHLTDGCVKQNDLKNK